MSCKSSNSAALNNNIGGDGNILFVNLKIRKDDRGNESIELVERIWSSGSLKTSVTVTTDEHSLTCKFFDTNKKEIQRLIVANPLHEQKESYSPDGSIQRNQLDVTEAFFTIRTKISREVHYLTIENSAGNDLKKIALIR
jgi:hypothetical protein